jgi:hypothetical protein
MGDVTRDEFDRLVERVARSERTQGAMVGITAAEIVGLRTYLAERFGLVDHRLDGIDHRLGLVDHRLDGIDLRLGVSEEADRRSHATRRDRARHRRAAEPQGRCTDAALPRRSRHSRRVAPPHERRAPPDGPDGRGSGLTTGSACLATARALPAAPLMSDAMAFGRKKSARRERDPFAHLADERREAESETWFLQPDDGPELEVETGISSNLSDDDVES